MAMLGMKLNKVNSTTLSRYFLFWIPFQSFSVSNFAFHFGSRMPFCSTRPAVQEFVSVCFICLAILFTRWTPCFLQTLYPITILLGRGTSVPVEISPDSSRRYPQLMVIGEDKEDVQKRRIHVEVDVGYGLSGNLNS